MPTVGRPPCVHHDGIQFQDDLMSRLQMFAQIYGERVLYKFSDFAHGIGKSFELEGDNLGDGIENESFGCIGAHLALLTEIFVGALEFFHCEETADALEE